MTKRKRSDPAKATVQFKSFGFDTKAVAAEPDEDGMVFVRAYGSVFNVLDSHEDMTVQGTFKDTLEAWATKGAPIPSYYNHGLFSGDPHDNIGYLSEAKEDDHGLDVMIGLDVGHNEKAAYVHRLIKQGRLRELSIGYIPKSWEYVKKDGATSEWDTYRKLTAVDLLEVSFVSVASNSAATVTEKAAALLYGAAADEDADEDPEAKEVSEDDAADAAELLAEAAAALVTVAENLTTVAATLAGDEETSEDEDTSTDDDTDQKAGAKSLSARARAALAMIAVSAAETE